MTPTHPTSFRLPDITQRQLSALCKMTGQNQSAVVVMAIDRMYQQENRTMSKQTQTLGELLYKGLQYDSSWGIYAFGTGVDSPARIGQTQFECGGIMDGMSFIIDGVRLGDAFMAYMDYPTDDEFEDVKSAISASEFFDYLLEDGWIEYEEPECYQTDPGCPKCGGAMYGADFPNGDGHGTCCVCGHEAEWDNEAAEWIES